MDVREKLIELLADSEYLSYEAKADHLIANGVVVATDNNVDHTEVTIKPDGIHELSPHRFVLDQRLRNVTVEILHCKCCGKVSVGWHRQENTEEQP